ncbi:MAG: hypothetical protein IPJ82_18850 [Lewinellaceae bacterium]|nr:hypothetical protein [Lewinellaceae bacterium]
MKNITFSSALALIALCIAAVSCTKSETEIAQPVADTFPSIPAGNRIIIHFGTSTQFGCMYSFSNCIWIGWGDVLASQNALALQLSDGEQADRYFGDYFPLTADYTVDAATAEALGIKEQVIPAGFYPLNDSPTGKTVTFSPEFAQPVAPLVNPNNPQDNIGQLHNLAMQVILSPENKGVIKQMNGHKEAIRQFVLDKTIQFLDESGVQISKEEQKKVQALELRRNYADFAARQNETRLSENDKKALRPIMDEVAHMPVSSPEELSHFVEVMTNFENNLASDTQLDDPKMVLSTLSVLKYSRYYWYWKSVSAGGSGVPEPAQIPEWVWADAIAFELGGPIASIATSIIVYLDTH